MCNENMTNNTNHSTENGQPAMVKKIGKTTYRVRVHFSTSSKETMNDKIKRMLRNEVKQT